MRESYQGQKTDLEGRQAKHRGYPRLVRDRSGGLRVRPEEDQESPGGQHQGGRGRQHQRGPVRLYPVDVFRGGGDDHPAPDPVRVLPTGEESGGIAQNAGGAS